MNVCVCVSRTATRGQPNCAIIPVVVAVAIMWACVCICRFWCLRWSATTTAAQLRSLASSLWRSRNVWPKFSQTHTCTYICSKAYSLIPTHTYLQTLSAHLLHFACALSRLLLLDAAVFCCCFCLFFALRSLSLQFAQIRISVAIFFCTSFCTCKLRERCVQERGRAMGKRVCAMRIAEICKEGNASEGGKQSEL